MDNLFLIFIPITIGVVEAFKNSVPKKYHPSLSIGVGITLMILAFLTDKFAISFWQSVLIGIIVGLSSSGFYDHKVFLK